MAQIKKDFHIGYVRARRCSALDCSGDERGCSSASCQDDARWSAYPHADFVEEFERCPDQCKTFVPHQWHKRESYPFETCKVYGVVRPRHPNAESQCKGGISLRKPEGRLYGE